MTTMQTTITVPKEKAEALRIIANATPETLRILASKCTGKSESDFKALEAKLKTWQGLI